MSVQEVEEEVELKKGGHVRVVTAESDKDKTDQTTIWVDYPNLPRVLEKGSKIYIDDGLIGLKVVEIGTCFWMSAALIMGWPSGA